ncbi:hypothetical protein MDAP_002130 [Mitosporidium daphniae]
MDANEASILESDQDSFDEFLQQNQDSTHLLNSSIREIQPFLLSKCPGKLNSEGHVNFALNLFKNSLPFASIALDTSRPWLLYWSLSILTLLKMPIPDNVKKLCLSQLHNEYYIEQEGAYGGSSSCSSSHILTTFASLCSLALIGGPDDWSKINTQNLLAWLSRLFSPEKGVFSVHLDGGESDLRSVYAAIAIIHLLGLEKEFFHDPCSLERIQQSIISAQSYEGGFGAIPWSHTEAHGGYTYCGLAALVIIDRWTLSSASIDTLLPESKMTRLLAWTCGLQSTLLGGLQGRTGKLVDACYSFWVGAIPLLLNRPTKEYIDVGLLRNYLLKACQCSSGGIRDKPPK